MFTLIFTGLLITTSALAQTTPLPIAKPAPAPVASSSPVATETASQRKIHTITLRPLPARVIDLGKPLPADLELTVGEVVAFENGPRPLTVSGKETDGQGKLLTAHKKASKQQIAAFRAHRVGSGEITITFESQGPGHKPLKPHTIKVKILKDTRPAALQKATLQLNKGDAIVLTAKFDSDPSLYDLLYVPVAKTTDSDPGDVFGTDDSVTRWGEGLIKVARFNAEREGKAEISFLNSDNNDVVQSFLVTVNAAKEADPVVTVNMADKRPPLEIELLPGEQVIFKRPHYSAKTSSEPSDGKKEPLLKFIQTVSEFAHLFQAQRSGTGEITCDFGDGTKKTVKVTVHPRALSYDLTNDSPPASIKLLDGQRVCFTAKEIVQVAFSTTDGNTGDVLNQEKRLVRLAAGWTSFSCFQSERIGTGEFTLTWFDSKGNKVKTIKIPVTVK